MATSYPGRVGSQVCASTGRYCISPASCRSYSHPHCMCLPDRSARLAYPHKAHRIETDQAPPQFSRGPSLNLVSPYAPYCEASPFHLSYSSTESPCPPVRLSVLSLDR